MRIAIKIRRRVADMKKLCGIIFSLLVGTLFLASCGSDKTTSKTTASTGMDLTQPFPNAALLVAGASLDVNAANQVIIDTRPSSSYTAKHVSNAINLNPAS